MAVWMDATRKTTIFASKFNDGEISRQHSTKLAQCLECTRLCFCEDAPSAGIRRALRPHLNVRFIDRDVRGCARCGFSADVNIVARWSAIRRLGEEKWIRVTGRKSRRRRGNRRFKPCTAECGIERVCEGQPRHAAVIGQASSALNLARPSRPSRPTRP